MRFGLLPENPFKWVVRSFQERGLIQTAKVAWSFFNDMSFDWRFGTETIRRVDIYCLKGIDLANKANGYKYGASKAKPFIGLLKRLNLPRSSVFVDIGCGKGKVLLLASQFQFKRIVGIDFSPELCRMARANIAVFEKRKQVQSLIDIVECDAALFQFSPEENVFFMFDPFNKAVLEQVLNNLRFSLNEAPRKIWVIYHSPRHHKTIEKSRLFKICRNYDIIGTKFKVYMN